MQGDRVGRGVAEGAFLYTKTRVKLEALLSGRDHVRVRYEDFVAEPATALAPAMDWLGLEFERSQLEWANGPHHQICGNHMRFATTSSMRLDEDWTEGLSIVDRGVVASLTWPASFAESLLRGRQSSSTSR